MNLDMSGISEIGSIPLKLDSLRTDLVHFQRANKFISVIPSSNASLVYIFDHHGEFLHTITLPGFCIDDCPGAVSCCWSGNDLAIVSSLGHVVVWNITLSSFELKRSFALPIGYKGDRCFSHVAYSKNSEYLFVLSRMEILVFEVASSKLVKMSKYTQNGVKDCPTCFSVHPTASVVAIGSTRRRSIIVAPTGVGNLSNELKHAIMTKPIENDSTTPESPSTDDSHHHLPNMLNEIRFNSNRAVPTTIAWSKYGETLIFGSSDNLLSIWKIPSKEMETVCLGEPEIVIRNTLFINDVFVVVSINDSDRILIINIDDGILYESQDPISKTGFGLSSKSRSLELFIGSRGVVLQRLGDNLSIRQWELST